MRRKLAYNLQLKSFRKKFNHCKAMNKFQEKVSKIYDKKKLI